jgi:Ribbon-helix-helix protein, copG family.
MARPKKENTPTSFRLDTAVLERLTHFCEESGQSKTVAVERAITFYINDYEDKQRRIKKPVELISD